MLENVEFFVKDEKYGYKACKYSDFADITDKYILNFHEWLEANPEERKRLGIIRVESVPVPEFNRGTHTIVGSLKMTGEFDAIKEYHLIEKTEYQIADSFTSLVEDALYIRGMAGGIIIG